MAVQQFEEALTIGHGEHLQEMNIRRGELLVGFTDAFPADEIESLLAGFGLVPAPGVEPDRRRRAALQGYHWVSGPEDSLRDIARQVLQAVEECWFASPVYVPADSPVVEDASVPLPGTLIVRRDLETASDLASDIEPLRLRWDNREAVPGLEDGETSEPGTAASVGAPTDPLLDAARDDIAYLTLRGGIADDGFDVVERVRLLPGVVAVGWDWLKIDPVEQVPKNAPWVQRWNLDTIKVGEAWKITEGDSRVMIAVIDTGFDLGHEALDGSFSAPATHACFSKKGNVSFIRTDDASIPLNPTPAGTNTTDDISWHGTAVAGIIAGSLLKSDTPGIAPGCKILPIRLRDFTFVTIREALRWARLRGAKVINLSISAAGPEYGVESEINKAVLGGAVVCAAAGNGGSNNPNAPVVYPAAYVRTIAVGAAIPPDDEPKEIDTGIERWYSRQDPNLDVLAPGIRIPTVDARGDCGFVRTGDAGQQRSVTWYQATTYYDDEAGPPGGLYCAVFTGTSAAVAHVSALAGLLWSLPLASTVTEMTADRVRAAIEGNCLKVGKAAYGGGYPNGSKAPAYGYGRIDVEAALKNP
jgi:subtilisin family serine protease